MTPAFYYLFIFKFLFLLSLWSVNLSPSLYFESLCVLAYEMDLDTAYHWVLTFYSICLSVSLIGAFNPFKFRIDIDNCEFNIVV